MEKLYKLEICTNCANKNCTNKIQVTRTQDVIVDQISTVTTVKCEDFICKDRGKKIPARYWKRW